VRFFAPDRVRQCAETSESRYAGPVNTAMESDYPLFADEPKMCTVTELTLQIKDLVEEGFRSVWVCGEIGTVSRPSSGHLYFTLKDKQAQIRAVLWRLKAQRFRQLVREGHEVIVRGSLSVYPPRGDYQLVIEDLQPRGEGAQDLALRKLKEKLARLGFFLPERKRPLPSFPRHIALITSPSGAAIRDMLEILSRRWPPAQVWVCPVRVQGEEAPREIAWAIDMVNRVAHMEVLILGRGGGSAEDLAAFNHEGVAQAIFASRVPVVSAVGHEIDVTIADMVADRRALTPSEAAELVTPDRDQLLQVLQAGRLRMQRLLERRLELARQRLRDLQGRRSLARPLEPIRVREERLDDLEGRLSRAIRQQWNRARQRLDAGAARLDALSPLNVLARGYSLTRREKDHLVLREPGQVEPGDRIVTVLAKGTIASRVEP